jgi:trk system potassium uptake protein TrkH
MFIGASPGSTGGGIKTTTAATIYAVVRSRLFGHKDVPVMKRSISQDTVNDAIIIVTLSLVLVFSGTFILSLVQSDISLTYLLFEEISAFGTVGLSCGITDKLCFTGKLVIIVTMFLGRVGPLTFLFAMSGRKKFKKITNIEEKISIG